MPPDSRVIVIVGASSGMGRGAAVRFAARGAKLVLAARRAELLEEVVRECEAAGGEAVAVPADTSRQEQVEEVAQVALARFGRIDVWVQAAAVAAFGRFLDIPLHSAKRLLDVSLYGSVIASHVALREFTKQRRGTLVLVGSILGKAPMPYLSVYNTAKHGLVGLAGTLREEMLKDDYADVHVSLLLPPATDTPFYVHAANYTGKQVRPPPPVYRVDTLADAIVDMADRPRDEYTVGAAGKLTQLSHALAKGAYDRAVGPYSETLLTDEAASPTDGSLFEPMRQGRAPDGGWKPERAASRGGR